MAEGNVVEFSRTRDAPDGIVLYLHKRRDSVAYEAAGLSDTKDGKLALAEILEAVAASLRAGTIGR